MTKIRNGAIVLLCLILLLIGLYFGSPDTNSHWGLLVTAGALGFWLIIIWAFEKKRIDPRIIALVATMAALATLTRIAFAPIAGFKPTTFIIMITAYVCGPTTGFAVGALTGLASNFFLGQGPWTPWQMVSWGLCGVLAGLMGRQYSSFQRLPFTILTGICGILFGWVMNIWHWVAFIDPLNVKTFVATYIASLPFDLLHAAGNIVFSLLLGTVFYRIINRVYMRIRVVKVISAENDNRLTADLTE